MDEPFSALDVKTKEELRQLVKTAIKEYQTTTVHVTHDLDDVWSLATKVVMMQRGKILQVGPPEHIFTSPINDFVADFVGTNTFKCKIISRENGFTLLEAGKNVKLYSKDQGTPGKETIVAIRPEHILISSEPVSEHAPNVFCGTITNTKIQGGVVWLTLNINGLPLKAILTSNAYELLNLKEKTKVFIAVKSRDVKIVS
jgi:molybdate transport system ATP-binding protein